MGLLIVARAPSGGSCCLDERNLVLRDAVLLVEHLVGPVAVPSL